MDGRAISFSWIEALVLLVDRSKAYRKVQHREQLQPAKLCAAQISCVSDEVLTARCLPAEASRMQDQAVIYLQQAQSCIPVARSERSRFLARFICFAREPPFRPLLQLRQAPTVLTLTLRSLNTHLYRARI